MAKKQAYFGKLVKHLENYNKILIVGVDNVGSNHMQKIRGALRGKAEIVMGKNTMIRKVMRGFVANNADLEQVIPLVRGNIGFVFVKDDLAEVKKVLLANKVSAPAKAGAIAPCDVTVPAGNTGLEPTMTSFFQALAIQTKIAKGQIEITSDVHLVKEGHKVGTSEAALLQKLDIKPFKYGLTIKTVYDNGTIYDAKVLDLSDADIIAKFQSGVKNIAAIGLQIGYPTVASLPHSLARGWKNVLAVSLATEYSIKQAEELKSYLANPGAFAQAAPTQAAPADKGGKKPAAVVVEEPKEVEDEDMGFGLFD